MIVIRALKLHFLTNMEGYEFNGRIIKPHWSRNWGDQIALSLIKALSDNVVQTKFDTTITEDNIFGLLGAGQEFGKKDGKLLSIGSVMNYTQPNDFVWGTGCIDQKQVGFKPKKITAVRGPLTRHEITSIGWECPEIYGDPVLLLPKVLGLEKAKKYKYGIIPHYVEFLHEDGLKILKHLENLGYKIIDICSGNINFVDEVSECERILSSSLHGLIIADAYNIPNARIIITDKLAGSHFKFVDYCMSVHRRIEWGINISEKTTNSDINKIPLNDKIYFNEDRLLEAAPWHLADFKNIL